MLLFILYLITGAFAGLLAGLLGLGGGIIIIPVLIVLLPSAGIPADLLMPVAIATSLSSVIINTSVASFAQWRKDNIDFGVLKKAFIPITIGSILGPILAHYIPTAHLKQLFAVLLFVVAFRMFRGAHAIEKVREFPSVYRFTPVILLLSFISSLLGLGGGVLLLPYLNRCGLTMQRSIGTASFSAMIVAMVASACYVLMGSTLTTPLPNSIGYIYLPAFLGIILTSFMTAKIGVSLSHRLPIPQLKKIFAVIVFFIAIKMIL
jgi:uncharacterized membrane protein YfcA